MSIGQIPKQLYNNKYLKNPLIETVAFSTSLDKEFTKSFTSPEPLPKKIKDPFVNKQNKLIPSRFSKKPTPGSPPTFVPVAQDNPSSRLFKNENRLLPLIPRTTIEKSKGSSILPMRTARKVAGTTSQVVSTPNIPRSEPISILNSKPRVRETQQIPSSSHSFPKPNSHLDAECFFTLEDESSGESLDFIKNQKEQNRARNFHLYHSYLWEEEERREKQEFAFPR